MALFPQQKEEGLINEVEYRPTLYDKSDKNYSNRDVCAKLWMEVAEQIGLDATSCKVKWQSLRDYYLRKRRENTKKSGQAASKKRQWYLYDRMSFLDPFVAARATSGNLDIARDHGENITDITGDGTEGELRSHSSEECVVVPSTSTTGTSKSGTKKRKWNQHEMIDKEILKTLQKDDENEHELFFKSLIPTVSQLDSIQTMLFRAEVQHLAVKYLKQQQASRSSTSASPPPSLNRETIRDDHDRGHHRRSSTPAVSAYKTNTDDQGYQYQYATNSSASSALSCEDTFEDSSFYHRYYTSEEKM